MGYPERLVRIDNPFEDSRFSIKGSFELKE